MVVSFGIETLQVRSSVSPTMRFTSFAGNKFGMGACSDSTEKTKQTSKLCYHITFVCLFDLILYVPSTIFQLNRDGSYWVEPVLS